MAFARTPIAGIILTGGIATLAAVFGFLNMQWLTERTMVEREGLSAIAIIDRATISHKACNSSVDVRWSTADGTSHAQRFMTCSANRFPGERIAVRYLERDPKIAMIADGDGGIDKSQFRTGMFIGIVTAAIMALVTASLLWRRFRAVSL